MVFSNRRNSKSRNHGVGEARCSIDAVMATMNAWSIAKTCASSWNLTCSDAGVGASRIFPGVGNEGVWRTEVPQQNLHNYTFTSRLKNGPLRAFGATTNVVGALVVRANVHGMRAVAVHGWRRPTTAAQTLHHSPATAAARSGHSSGRYHPFRTLSWLPIRITYWSQGVASLPHKCQPPLSSPRQHPSYGDCLEVKREYY